MLVTPHLVAYYPFEGNANDASGNGNNGTVYGASLTKGKFGQCYSFDGVDDNISIPDSTTLRLINSNNNFSITAWIKTSQVTSSNWEGFLFEIREITDWDRSAWLQIYTDGTALFGFSEHDISNRRETKGITIVTDDEWHFIVGTKKEDVRTLYVDGVAENTSAQTGTQNSLNGATIGCRRTDAGSKAGFFNGLIDQVQIYNKALSQSDIRRIMLGMHPLNG